MQTTVQNIKNVKNNIKILPHLIADRLKEQNLSIGVAESCTGGYISHLITSLEGSSEYFKGGIIAYSNEIKIKILQVEEQIIDKYGTVSKEVVTQMAKNLLLIENVDYSIAVSGIAGTRGGSAKKPVGTVWISVADKNQTKAECFSFLGDRELVIKQASMSALQMLYSYMMMSEE